MDSRKCQTSTATPPEAGASHVSLDLLQSSPLPNMSQDKHRQFGRCVPCCWTGYPSIEKEDKFMSERTCDVCGKKRDLSGGKTCAKGHFISKSCVYSGVVIISEKKYCPLDKTALR